MLKNRRMEAQSSKHGEKIPKIYFIILNRWESEGPSQFIIFLKKKINKRNFSIVRIVCYGFLFLV